MSRRAPPAPPAPLARLADEIVRCRACPRLVAWREEVARTKRRAYRGEAYWGRPVPPFGDPRARIVLVGLAPGAHGRCPASGGRKQSLAVVSSANRRSTRRRGSLD